jgi:hypothetical protein
MCYAQGTADSRKLTGVNEANGRGHREEIDDEGEEGNECCANEWTRKDFLHSDSNFGAMSAKQQVV